MADEPNNFAEWVRQYPMKEAAELAQCAIEGRPDLLVAVVMREIEHVRRLEVQTLETRAMRDFVHLAPLPPSNGGLLALPPPTTAFLQLLRESFALGDGTRVTWGEATVTQHEQRMHLLRVQVAGLTVTLRHHAVAVEQLKAAGVSF